MGDVVELKPAGLENDLEFVSDLARFRENLLDEKAIRKKYRLANDVWEKLADDDALIRKVEAESTRRIRDGSSKREKAQQLVVRAPDILGKIMDDDSQSARHRIDSAKVLNDFAANGPQGVPASDRFVITINLGGDSPRFDKSIEVNPNDVDPNEVSSNTFGYPDPLPPDMVAAITAKKRDGGSSDNNTL